ncbi:hypothetical protein ABID42_002718 [Arcicella rosea]|uniref:hypothetical protein n=1 Tax=Arcicella rosea TaxID=502909 RepID=UPI00345CC639
MFRINRKLPLNAFHLRQAQKTMKKKPLLLTAESVEVLVTNIVEELLKGQNTYKSETDALKRKIKIGMLRTLTYQKLIRKQQLINTSQQNN